MTTILIYLHLNLEGTMPIKYKEVIDGRLLSTLN